MKLPCEMVEDLLPLYAEDMVTNATRAAVEEHLSDCESCRKKLDAMRQEKPDAAGQMLLEPVRREIRLRRWSAVIAAVCAVAAVLVTIIAWQSSMVYLSYDACGISVETLPDGGTEIHYTGANGMQEWMQDGIVYVAALGYRDQNSGECIMTLTDEKAVYFVDVTKHGETTLIWGDTPDEAVGAAQILPRLTLGYYLLIAAIAGIALLTAAFLMRGRRTGKAAKGLGLLALCYAAAHFLVMGTTSMSFNMARDFGFIVTIALLLWGLVMSGEQLLRQARRDRG